MAKAAHNRRDRLGNQVREVIAQCLLFEAKDPRLKVVNITDVELSGDLSHAKVYYYGHQLTETKQRSLQRALESAKGFLRHRLGKEIRARVTPDLVFYYDDSIERGAEIEALITAVRQEDQRLAVLYTADESSSEADESSSEADESSSEADESSSEDQVEAQAEARFPQSQQESVQGVSTDREQKR